MVKRRNLCSDAVEGGGAPADRLRVRGSVQSESFSTTFPLDAVSSETGEESLHEQNSGSIFISFFKVTRRTLRDEPSTQSHAQTRTSKHIQPHTRRHARRQLSNHTKKTHAHMQTRTQTCRDTRGPLFHGLTPAGSNTVTAATKNSFYFHLLHFRVSDAHVVSHPRQWRRGLARHFC